VAETDRQKVRASHLSRKAYLYIRQSTIHQVLHNTESTDRQYGLRRRALALGWQDEDIITIDCDTGQSGASAADREGFQQLVTEVGLGRAGIVLGLEVSRLARNSSDWHRLLEICAFSGTLILDEDGLYDPAHFNDRLLLGLKGTMSEAELHVLTARLQGGLLNKARRGELKMALPVGLAYDQLNRVTLDPDAAVRETLETFFRLFRQLGSAHAVVNHFRSHQLQFPRRYRFAARRGELVWGPLAHSRALNTLHNPRYAGAFVFGRTKSRKASGGGQYSKQMPQEEWAAVIPGAHAGYIDWEEYQGNQKILAAGKLAWGADRRGRPPGEGPALLQGLAVCGRCGRRMGVRYTYRNGQLFPVYSCMRRSIDFGEPVCQNIVGWSIDDAIASLLLEQLTSEAVELAMAVRDEVQKRFEEVDRLRYRHVERAAYEADVARERFMAVDARNRLVAQQLEADWNERLRRLEEVQAEYEAGKEKDRDALDGKCREKMRALTDDFPAVWNDAATSPQQRKRMARLLLEDVTMTRQEDRIIMQVRFRGGATRTLNIPAPLTAWRKRQTSKETIDMIDCLLEDHTEGEVAEILTSQGLKSPMGSQFCQIMVAKICRTYKVKTHFERLRARGLLTQEEMAVELGVSGSTVQEWRRCGLLRGFKHTGARGARFLYERPMTDQRPRKMQGNPLRERVALSVSPSTCQ